MCFTGVSFITASGCDTFMIFLVNGYANLEKILKACDVKVIYGTKYSRVN